MLTLYWIDKKSGAADAAIFDVVTTETHESILSITSHPVEEGSDVTDHARLEPERITVEGYVTNVPSIRNPGAGQVIAPKAVPLKIPPSGAGAFLLSPGGLTQAAGKGINAALEAVGLSKGLPKTMTVLTASGAWQDRARLFYLKLRQAQADRARITVVASKVQTLDNMLIERLAVPRTTADRSGLLFQVDLMRVRIVTSETVAAPEPAELRGVPSVSSGSQSTKNAENAAKKAEKEKTLAAQGWDAAAARIRGGISAIGGI